VNSVHVPLNETLHKSPDPDHLNPVVPVIAVNAIGELEVPKDPLHPDVQMTSARLTPGPTVTVREPVLKITLSPPTGAAPAR